VEEKKLEKVDSQDLTFRVVSKQKRVFPFEVCLYIQFIVCIIFDIPSLDE
jgi:hypothetical protein